MSDATTPFKPGMLVAYGETRKGVMIRVICLKVVVSVGKRDVKTDSTSRFRLSGYDWSVTYRDRAIQPLTKALYTQAAADKASGMGLAAGHFLPD